MSNVESSSSTQPGENPDLYKLPVADVDGLESFDEEPAEAPPSPPPASPPRGPTPAPAPAPQTPPRAPSVRRARSFSIFWPLVLIMGGGLLLLQNLGYLAGLSWGTLWRFWPLLLIALGIETLFGRRSRAGAVFSALLILALLGGAIYFVMNASSFPWMSRFVEEPGWQSEQVSYPLAGVERANVTIDWASVPLRLEALGDSPNLLEGTVVYRGRLHFDTVRGRRTSLKLSTEALGAGWSPSTWTESLNSDGREQRWVLGLSPRVPIDLDLDGGSGTGELDLRGLDLEELGMDVASGAVDIYLPRGEYEAWIEGGSGSLDLWLPPGSGVQLVVDGGSGALRVGERFRLVEGERDGDGVWESDNLGQADQILRIRIDVASGMVRVRDWE